MSKLKREIIDYLVKKLHKSENSVRVEISNLRTNKFPGIPLNSVAQIYAKQHGKTVYQKLSKEEKQSIPSHEITRTAPKVSAKKIVKKESAFEFLKYETTDHFIKGHLREINRTYNQRCYTATFILARKIVENFIIDILIAKFPEKTQANKELYYDTARGRFKDFSIILDTLNSKKNEFGINKTVVERLYAKAKTLKADANDKTHSWFHLVEGKTEIDDLHLQTIIELVKQLQKK